MHNCNFLFQKGKHEIELLFQKRIGGKREWEAKGGEKEKKKDKEGEEGKERKGKEVVSFYSPNSDSITY